MARSEQNDWLAPDAGDLAEAVVEDVPVKGKSVKIRALSATQANAATSQAITTTEQRGQPRMTVDSVKLDIIRFAEGVVEPKFTVDEATIISAKFGPAFNRVVSEIVRISDLDREAIAETEARFPGSGVGAAGTNGADSASGHGRPPVPARAGARAGDDG